MTEHKFLVPLAEAKIRKEELFTTSFFKKVQCLQQTEVYRLKSAFADYYVLNGNIKQAGTIFEVKQSVWRGNFYIAICELLSAKEFLKQNKLPVNKLVILCMRNATTNNATFQKILNLFDIKVQVI